MKGAATEGGKRSLAEAAGTLRSFLRSSQCQRQPAQSLPSSQGCVEAVNEKWVKPWGTACF